MRKVGIGIPTFNGPKRVADLLNSIHEHTHDIDYVINVLDDCSRPDENEKIKAICKTYDNVSFLSNPTNMGLPFNWNKMVRNLDAEIVVLLNDDILVVKDWLKALVHFVDNNEKVGMVGWHVEENTKFKFDLGWTELGFERLPNAIGCCFGFKKELFELIGGADIRYFLFYEEIDLGYSLAKMGYDSWTIPYPTLTHLGGMTFKTNPNAGKDHMNVSRQQFISKWGGTTWFLARRLVCSIPSRRMKWYEPKEIDGKIVTEHITDKPIEFTDWGDKVKRCPKCLKTNFSHSVHQIVEPATGDTLNKLQFKCKECGHNWEVGSWL